MNREILLGLALATLLVCTLALASSIQPVKAGTIVVPDDYPTIQVAINAANHNDTIFVRTGVYVERVVARANAAYTITYWSTRFMEYISTKRMAIAFTRIPPPTTRLAFVDFILTGILFSEIRSQQIVSLA